MHNAMSLGERIFTNFNDKSQYSFGFINNFFPKEQ